MSDVDLALFLLELDASDNVEVNDWEAKFIESNLERKHFTDPQRTVIRGMMERYEARL